MRTLGRFVREDQAGQSLVEFAYTLPLFLLIITGLFDLARAVWQENTLAYAAREGTRYAIVHGTGHPVASEQAWPGNKAGVKEVVRRAAIGVSDITVEVNWPDDRGGTACYERTCRVEVIATAPFVPLPSQYLAGSAFQITLKGGSMLVIQR
ncbi:MAG: TadE/TadG family type IV pilus assembly protein [Candidatus Limnocylindria bacterium]